jgi:hypothetical protein
MCMNILELLREEIKGCEKQRKQISIDTGVDTAVLCRMMQGGSCKAQTIDALLPYFGYELVKRKER